MNSLMIRIFYIISIGIFGTVYLMNEEWDYWELVKDDIESGHDVCLLPRFLLFLPSYPYAVSFYNSHSLPLVTVTSSKLISAIPCVVSSIPTFPLLSLVVPNLSMIYFL